MVHEDNLESRILQAFDTLDSDRDGMVKWSDYQDLINRIGGSENDLQSFYQIYWQEILLHADGAEEPLTREDFITGRLGLTFSPGQDDALKNGADSIFQGMANNDGDEVSQSEFTHFLDRVWRISRGAEGAFAELDTDGDGRVSRQEFVGAARAFFSSPDQGGAAGAVLFGEITLRR